jgi:bacterioferritin
MGQKGREIVKMDVDKLINMLNKALSDEWLAYDQYWIGAK